MIHSGYYLYDGGGTFGDACAVICERAGLARWGVPDGTLVAVAPMLRRKLPRAEWDAPLYGTLVFHPSILPYHRGPDAIRWAVRLGERVSGATWFWCDDGLDTGPLCEQEPVLIDPSKGPGENYRGRFVPAGLRALERAVAGVTKDLVRRIPQDEALATYEPSDRGAFLNKVI